MQPFAAIPRSGVIHPALPELLAPAGHWDCARAAVENGADAIYFGLGRFNARMRADNFTLDDLPELMTWLHSRGVRGYVTFNTLIFESELRAARQDLLAIIAAGVDAAIVQDAGICRLIRSLSPDFPIHASTQMTITSAAGIEFAQKLGCNLVVLARECSLKDIEAIQASRKDGPAEHAAAPMPLEVFVHGALCVAYSGQCLTSEALGGRSANRGECAQACRMPYELISDGQPVPLGDRRYLLSPQDLAGLEVLPGLIQSGVASLKIEGRLKSPEYVANITSVYRQALDKLGGQASKTGESEARTRYRMEMAFSRGLFTGWFEGIDNQKLVHARFGKKRGVFLGTVEKVDRASVQCKLQAPLKAGDGVVFDSGHPEGKEQGGRVYGVTVRGPLAHVEFGWKDIDLQLVHAGDRIWKTDDPELNRELRKSFEGPTPRHTRPLRAKVSGECGSPMRLEFCDEDERCVEACSSLALAVAEKRPLNDELLQGQLGRLGGTPFHLESLENRLVGQVILPMSELNALRRQAVQKLENLRAQRAWTLLPHPPAEAPTMATAKTWGVGPATMAVLIRSSPQLDVALECGVETVYCEFEDPKRYAEAVQRFRQHHSKPSNATIWTVPPRIFKPGEDWILAKTLAADADGILVRNHDHLRFFSGRRMRGDFSLNAANHLSVELFTDTLRLERVTASYDLNTVQLDSLIRAVDPEKLEITLHQHMPMFHMEHCVFCAFLSKGKDYRDCGRPCDNHEVRLRDRVGQQHLLKADAGCRNTLFNALAQTGAEGYSTLRAAGARHFRVEFLDESPEVMRKTLGCYASLLRGDISGAAVWRQLRVTNQLGVTRGQLESSDPSRS